MSTNALTEFDFNSSALILNNSEYVIYPEDITVLNSPVTFAGAFYVRTHRSSFNGDQSFQLCLGAEQNIVYCRVFDWSTQVFGAWETVAGGGGAVTVVDNLNSTSITSALSANQGNVLKGMIDSGAVTVEDNLTSTSAVNALSANQGRVLDDKISALVVPVVVDVLTSQSATDALSANQGFVLKGLIDAIVVPALNNTLTSVATNESLTAAQGKVLKDLIDAIVVPTVIDSLISSSTTNALSANQGKVLKALIEGLFIPTVIDDLTTADATNALSANQGVVIKGLIDAIIVPALNNTLTSTATDESLTAAQGKVLKDLIDGLVIPALNNTLTSTATDESLTAAQGKVLKDLIDALPAVVDNLTTTSTTQPLSANQGVVLKALVDAGAGGIKDRGVFDASALSVQLDDGVPGDFWEVSVTGTVLATNFYVGDGILVKAPYTGTPTDVSDFIIIRGSTTVPAAIGVMYSKGNDTVPATTSGTSYKAFINYGSLEVSTGFTNDLSSGSFTAINTGLYRVKLHVSSGNFDHDYKFRINVGGTDTGLEYLYQGSAADQAMNANLEWSNVPVNAGQPVKVLYALATSGDSHPFDWEGSPFVCLKFTIESMPAEKIEHVPTLTKSFNVIEYRDAQQIATLTTSQTPNIASTATAFTPTVDRTINLKGEFWLDAGTGAEGNAQVVRTDTNDPSTANILETLATFQITDTSQAIKSFGSVALTANENYFVAKSVPFGSDTFRMNDVVFEVLNV